LIIGDQLVRCNLTLQLVLLRLRAYPGGWVSGWTLESDALALPQQTNKQTGISQINPSYPSQVGGNLFGKEHMHYLGSAEYQRV
jgi:hypothetical protein